MGKYLKESAKGKAYSTYGLDSSSYREVRQIQDKAIEINNLLYKSLNIKDEDLSVSYHDCGLYIQYFKDINEDYDYGVVVNVTKVCKGGEILIDSVVNHKHKSWEDIPRDASSQEIVSAIIRILERDGRL